MDRSAVIFNYVIANFKLKFDIDEALLKIDYLNDTGAKVCINNNGRDFFDKNKNIDHLTVYYNEWKGKRIPFFFVDHTDNILTVSERKIYINVDIIACSFYFLSGWQEQFTVNNDQFGRFPFKESIQHKLDIATLPVVNYYFDILKTAIEHAYNITVRTRTKSSFSVILSHDIDEINTLWLQEGYHALKKGRIASLPSIILKRLKKSSIVEPSIARLLSLEKENNINADFFLLCKDEKEGIYKNADYRIADSNVIKVIEEIVSAGNNIGVHGSFHTHQSAVNLNADIEALKKVSGKNITGNRFHFLSYDYATTPDVLQECKINYDSTLGFAEHIGFRNSYANPFLLFNNKRFQSTTVLEFPLSLMDASLYFPQYMRCNYEQSLEYAKRLISEIEFVNGLLVINWHNSAFLLHKYDWLYKLLKAIIAECRSKKGEFTTMNRMNDAISLQKIISE